MRNFIERAAREAAMAKPFEQPLVLCTCGTALKVRGTSPLVLEPCPTCLDALRQGVVGKLERLLDETYSPPKAEGSLSAGLAELREVHKRSDWARMDDPVADLMRMRYGDEGEQP